MGSGDHLLSGGTRARLLTFLVDHSRSGRPPLWDIEATEDEVGNRSSTCTRRSSDSLGPSENNIQRHLKSLSKTYKSCRLASHELNEIQAKRRVKEANGSLP
ncbi:hypothetical protein EVAR_23462_1 [Eumeta japonica]|uniref:Uncharacterized protein n=1 Tax=Eumeta variegata TaxID=151549 RepID=A0A4C1UJS8_EUMVA|nr:hypothetical protein EVAR_23462_1 [Eumeta japonica]